MRRSSFRVIYITSKMNLPTTSISQAPMATNQVVPFIDSAWVLCRKKAKKRKDILIQIPRIPNRLTEIKATAFLQFKWSKIVITEDIRPTVNLLSVRVTWKKRNMAYLKIIYGSDYSKPWCNRSSLTHENTTCFLSQLRRTWLALLTPPAV